MKIGKVEQNVHFTKGRIGGWNIGDASLFGASGGTTIELNVTAAQPFIQVSAGADYTRIDYQGMRTSAVVANDVFVNRALFISADHVFLKTGLGSNGEDVYGGREGAYGSNGYALIERNGSNTTVNVYDLTSSHFITGNNIRYNTLTNLSDIRFKKFVKPLKYGLKQILALNPISYKYKQSKEDRIQDGSVHLGLSAQDVKEVMPELVMDGDRLSMSMIEMIPVLINSVKELQSQINSTNEQVNIIKNI